MEFFISFICSRDSSRQSVDAFRFLWKSIWISSLIYAISERAALSVKDNVETDAAGFAQFFHLRLCQVHHRSEEEERSKAQRGLVRHVSVKYLGRPDTIGLNIAHVLYDRMNQGHHSEIRI